MQNEQRRAGLRASEAEGGDEGRKPMIPRSMGLLQAIESAVEAAHVIGASGVDEPGGLMAKYHLIETPVEEGVLDIELANPLVGG